MNHKIIDEYAKQELRNGLIGLAGFNQEVAFFDYACVMVQKNYLENKNVRIVSGGQYFNSDFVGKGMLTCIIQGEHLMTPPSKIILRTLRELSHNHHKGILIVVPATTGNLFNFGLATDRAINDNLRVRLIYVNDTRFPNLGIHFGNKCMTGIVLIIKIAGAMSELGRSVSDIYAYCQKQSNNVVTVVINGAYEESDNICMLCKTNMCKHVDRKGGSGNITATDCLQAIENMINFIPDNTFHQEVGKMNLKSNESVVVLINNNGALKKVDEYNFIKELIQFLTVSLIQLKRIFISCYLISFEVSITFLKVDDDQLLEYLDAPCNALGKFIVTGLVSFPR